jgi:2,3-bisphosphoglycerate-dependent phosphoglycerate mutase
MEVAMEESTRIIAIRHGETLWNVDARIQGHLDIDLNAQGRWQADRAAAYLAEEPISAIYASDLSRAFETAQRIAARHQLTVTPQKDLRERAFGQFQGMTYTEIEQAFPHEAVAWRCRHPGWAAPGGGESLEALRQRVVGCVNRLAAGHTGEQVVLVAHGGVMDMLYRVATGLDLQAPRSWLLGNAAVNRLLWSPQGLTLVGWGDTGHLTDAALDESTA